MEGKHSWSCQWIGKQEEEEARGPRSPSRVHSSDREPPLQGLPLSNNKHGGPRFPRRDVGGELKSQSTAAHHQTVSCWRPGTAVTSNGGSTFPANPCCLLSARTKPHGHPIPQNGNRTDCGKFQLHFKAEVLSLFPLSRIQYNCSVYNRITSF